MQGRPEGVAHLEAGLEMRDFYNPANQHIFDAIRSVYTTSGPVDVVTVADELRRKSSFQPAIDTYEKAAECYRQYLAQVPAHKASAGQWIAICELSMARTATDAGDIDSSQIAIH